MDIICREVDYVYQQGSPFEKKVLHDVHLHLKQGQWTFIVGQTGSGKSTLVQLFNGLLQPSKGEVQVGNLILTPKNKKAARGLFQSVGLSFQYPEHQLFAETVEEDVAYGPTNLDWPETLIRKRVRQAIEDVGLSPSFLGRSPFRLSGGEKRKVALAGVLAMQPKLIILDEPTAGLDPQSKRQVLQQIKRWKEQDEQRTIITISHQMEDVVEYADTMVVMDQGKVIMQNKPYVLFMEHEHKLLELGLDFPSALKVWKRLHERQGQASIEMEGLASLREEDIFEDIMARFLSKGSKKHE